MPTIREWLGGKSSGQFGLLVDREKPEQHITLSFTPDTSATGSYSITMRSEGIQESVRFQLRSSEDVAGAAKYFEEYMNIDLPAGTYKVKLLSAPTVRAPIAARKPTQREPATYPARWRQDLRHYESAQHTTGPQEQYMEVLRRRLAADPRKWRVGDGVGYRVSGNQINRGFALAQVDSPNKMGLVRQVADTGLIGSRGEIRFADQWIPLGDLVRDHRYDLNR